MITTTRIMTNVVGYTKKNNERGKEAKGLYSQDNSFARACRSCCQAFLAETVETGNNNRCVTEAMHVLRRKLRKD